MKIDEPQHLSHALDPEWVSQRATALEKELPTRSAEERRHPRERVARRRQRILTAALAAIIGSAALVLIAAISPTMFDTGGTSVGPQTAAAQVLVKAGEQAANAAWTPFAPGEFSYVRSSTFVPRDSMPEAKSIPPENKWRKQGDGEFWISPEGAARGLGVTGVWRISCGHGATIIGYETRRIKILNPCTAKEVIATTWPAGGGTPAQRYHLVANGKIYDVSPKPSTQWRDTPETLMRRSWGVTLDEIENTNSAGQSAGENLKKLLDQALAASPSRGELPTRDRSRPQIEQAARFRAAVQMISGAPLPPELRQALFRWLAATKGAKLIGKRTDRAGRVGMAIRFVNHDVILRAPRSVTDRQLVAEARAAGATELKVRTSGKAFPISGYRTINQWSMTLIVDDTTGEVLQATETNHGGTTYQVKGTEAATAAYIGPPDKNGIRGIRWTHVSGGTGSGASQTVWLARTRVDNTESQLRFCNSHDDLC